jgi:hypothetical protein
MSRLCLLFALLCLAVVAQPVFPVAQGVTNLLETGYYQVGYQSYGEADVHLMPIGWEQHFEQKTGISFHSRDVQGRQSLLLHSPWRIAVGKTWVDYKLQFPAIQPISLQFGICMGTDAATDGVTFSAYAFEPGQSEQTLFREHYNERQWKDFLFNLDAFSGKV